MRFFLYLFSLASCAPAPSDHDSAEQARLRLDAYFANSQDAAEEEGRVLEKFAAHEKEVVHATKTEKRDAKAREAKWRDRLDHAEDSAPADVDSSLLETKQEPTNDADRSLPKPFTTADNIRAFGFGPNTEGASSDFAALDEIQSAILAKQKVVDAEIDRLPKSPNDPWGVPTSHDEKKSATPPMSLLQESKKTKKNKESPDEFADFEARQDTLRVLQDRMAGQAGVFKKLAHEAGGMATDSQKPTIDFADTGAAPDTAEGPTDTEEEGPEEAAADPEVPDTADGPTDEPEAPAESLLQETGAGNKKWAASLGMHDEDDIQDKFAQGLAAIKQNIKGSVNQLKMDADENLEGLKEGEDRAMGSKRKVVQLDGVPAPVQIGDDLTSAASVFEHSAEAPEGMEDITPGVGSLSVAQFEHPDTADPLAQFENKDAMGSDTHPVAWLEEQPADETGNPFASKYSPGLAHLQELAQKLEKMSGTAQTRLPKSPVAATQNDGGVLGELEDLDNVRNTRAGNFRG